MAITQLVLSKILRAGHRETFVTVEMAIRSRTVARAKRVPMLRGEEDWYHCEGDLSRVDQVIGESLAEGS